MKNAKLELLFFLKTNNVSGKLYITGSLFILIIIFLLAAFEKRPSFLSADIVMAIGFSFFIAGNLLSFFSKDKSDKSRGMNIGVALGILASLIMRFFN